MIPGREEMEGRRRKGRKERREERKERVGRKPSVPLHPKKGAAPGRVTPLISESPM
jgi:hypothetical protein